MKRSKIKKKIEPKKWRFRKYLAGFVHKKFQGRNGKFCFVYYEKNVCLDDNTLC